MEPLQEQWSPQVEPDWPLHPLGLPLWQVGLTLGSQPTRRLATQANDLGGMVASTVATLSVGHGRVDPPSSSCVLGGVRPGSNLQLELSLT